MFLHLIEPEAPFYLLLARFDKKLFFMTILNRVQFVISDHILPLNVRHRLQEHKSHRVRETLLQDPEHHTVIHEAQILVILRQLADNVESFN